MMITIILSTTFLKNKMEKKITNFSIDLDEKTQKQFENCYNCDFVLEASLMPDSHYGYVAPIGSVIKTKKFIVPSWVGYDIGCGVTAIKICDNENNIKLLKEKSKLIYNEVLKKVPMGKGTFNKIKNQNLDIKKLLDNLKTKTKQRKLFNYISQNYSYHLGTLGSGNHFAEINFFENEIWICVHSGSRGIGKKIATHFMEKASNGLEPERICPINSQEDLGIEYLNYANFCLDFALLNRVEISKRIYEILEKYLKGLNFETIVNKNHNHVVLENGFFIHRKGATPASKKELGIIPANMKEGCFLVEGLGNPDFLNSSSHGAGRKFSRRDSKKLISLKNFEKEMSGIISNVCEKTIDESPFCYKNIYEVMEKQKKSVKVLKHLRPIINFKGI